MPVCVKKVKDKYRVVECDSNRIVKNSKGTAIDGGGHESRQAAVKQMRAVNANMEKE